VRASRKAGRRQTQRTSELVIYLSDALSNIKPLKAMAKAGKFENLFSHKIAQLRRALKREVVSQYALKNLEEMLVAGAIGVGFYLATTRWNVPVSQLIVIGLLLFQTVASVGRLQRQFQKAVLLERPYWAVRELIEAQVRARRAVLVLRDRRPQDPGSPHGQRRGLPGTLRLLPPLRRTGPRDG